MQCAITYDLKLSRQSHMVQNPLALSLCYIEYKSYRLKKIQSHRVNRNNSSRYVTRTVTKIYNSVIFLPIEKLGTNDLWRHFPSPRLNPTMWMIGGLCILAFMRTQNPLWQFSHSSCKSLTNLMQTAEIPWNTLVSNKLSSYWLSRTRFYHI